jgi:hypothetical protein
LVGFTSNDDEGLVFVDVLDLIFEFGSISDEVEEGEVIFEGFAREGSGLSGVGVFDDDGEVVFALLDFDEDDVRSFVVIQSFTEGIDFVFFERGSAIEMIFEFFGDGGLLEESEGGEDGGDFVILEDEHGSILSKRNLEDTFVIVVGIFEPSISDGPIFEVWEGGHAPADTLEEAGLLNFDDVFITANVDLHYPLFVWDGIFDEEVRNDGPLVWCG